MGLREFGGSPFPSVASPVFTCGTGNHGICSTGKDTCLCQPWRLQWHGHFLHLRRNDLYASSADPNLRKPPTLVSMHVVAADRPGSLAYSRWQNNSMSSFSPQRADLATHGGPGFGRLPPHSLVALRLMRSNSQSTQRRRIFVGAG